MAILPCNFTIIWSEKDQSWGGHFPLEFRAHLYIFAISGGSKMGKHTELKSNPTFHFFAPPLVYIHLEKEDIKMCVKNFFTIPAQAGIFEGIMGAVSRTKMLVTIYL